MKHFTNKLFSCAFFIVLFIGLNSCQQAPPPEPPAMEDHTAQMETVVNGFLNAWNNHDATNIGEVMSDNFERWVNGKKEINGLPEMATFMEGNFAMSPDAHVTLKDQDYHGNTFYGAWTYAGTNSGSLGEGIPATNKSFSNDGFTKITLGNDGKASKEEVYFDSWNMNEQLGFTLVPPAVEEGAE